MKRGFDGSDNERTEGAHEADVAVESESEDTGSRKRLCVSTCSLPWAMEAMDTSPEDLSVAMDLLTCVRDASGRDLAMWSNDSKGPLRLGLSIVEATYYPVQQCLYLAFVRIVSVLRRERRGKVLERIYTSIPRVLRTALPNGAEVNHINPIQMRARLNKINKEMKHITSFRAKMCWVLTIDQDLEQLHHEGWLDLGAKALSFCRDDEAISAVTIPYSSIADIQLNSVAFVAKIHVSGETSIRLIPETEAQVIHVVTPPNSPARGNSSKHDSLMKAFHCGIDDISRATSSWDHKLKDFKAEVRAHVSMITETATHLSAAQVLRGRAVARIEYDARSLAQEIQTTRLLSLPAWYDGIARECEALEDQITNVSITVQENLQDDLDAITQVRSSATFFSPNLVALAGPWVLYGVVALSSSLGYI
ncbi:hypothetical protein ACHHYP_20017 [Achlya hypogyna]|uniref:Uncharacterized protein n=1 Tax=Achlya hypogyna TaxID=1202772 RepID=A0A1V9ZB19_ACHHY|nr:hypothetical protein ACHHYP_20017 [Achlya hypogyna]